MESVCSEGWGCWQERHQLLWLGVLCCVQSIHAPGRGAEQWVSNPTWQSPVTAQLAGPIGTGISFLFSSQVMRVLWSEDFTSKITGIGSPWASRRLHVLWDHQHSHTLLCDCFETAEFGTQCVLTPKFCPGPPRSFGTGCASQNLSVSIASGRAALSS